MSGSLLDWLTAAGTIGAATFAGWAAWSSATAARATRRMVEIERQRETDRVEVERTAQAKRLSVNLITESLHDEQGLRAVDFNLVITNASDSPVFKVRMKVVAGDGVWGPQLVGNFVPGQHVELYARIYTRSDLGNTDAAVRFIDVNGRAWVASARTAAMPDGDDPSQWISDGQAFATRQPDTYERGRWSGVISPDFDEWRDFSAEHE